MSLAPDGLPAAIIPQHVRRAARGEPQQQQRGGVTDESDDGHGETAGRQRRAAEDLAMTENRPGRGPTDSGLQCMLSAQC